MDGSHRSRALWPARSIGLICALALIVGVVIVVAPRADSSVGVLAPTSWIVTKTADTDDGACDTDCSLREAVVAANATGGDDEIALPAGIYGLTLDTHLASTNHGSLKIAYQMGHTSIFGAGRDTTIIDATTLRTIGLNNPDRVFEVANQAGLELVGVTITGGYTENALSAQRSGGGVWNWGGDLTITDSTIEGNVAGEDGGGIAASGMTIITNTIIRDNNTDPPDYNTTSSGGGIFNIGTMTIIDSTIALNASDFGGGVANQGDSTGILSVEGSAIDENTARRGGGLANRDGGTATMADSTVSNNHATRGWDTTLNSQNRGGGILNSSAEITVTSSTIRDNEAWATHAIDPASGGGGGIANHLGELTMSGSTITGNEAICDQKLPGDPDLCGRGGGIVNAGGLATIINSTISANTAALLNSTHSPYVGGGGGGGFAHMPQVAGATVFCPISHLDSVTITDNGADHGGGVNTHWQSWGGGIYDVAAWAVGDGYECPDMYVNNTLIASNSTTFTAGSEDSWGGYTSQGHNLVGLATGAPTSGPGDVAAVDPLLGQLADNGGSTATHSLSVGSPARDSGSTSESVDQRGVGRPLGAADDIGAFEADPTAPTCAGDLVTLDMNQGASGLGTAGNDVILGTAANDFIDGDAGNDTICAGGGRDNIRGGPGTDIILGERGADTIRGGGGGDVIDGGPAADYILGQAGTDWISGGGGDDTIEGLGAADTIDGGSGADTIAGQNGADTIDGGRDADVIRGHTGPDTLRGSDGDDTLLGGEGADTLYGGIGFDKCSGNTGPDSAEAATCEQTPGVEMLF